MDLLLAFLFYQDGLPPMNHLAESYAYFFLYILRYGFSAFCYVLIYCDPSCLYEVFKKGNATENINESLKTTSRSL